MKKRNTYRQAVETKELAPPPANKETEWIITFDDTTIVEKAQTAHQAWMVASKKSCIPHFSACKVQQRGP